jgi:RNA polymerase sigma-70 factor (ECF subfamily)
MLAPIDPVMAPEKPLDQLLQEGKYRQATALCAEKHGASVGRLCMAMLGNQAEAQEVAQETFLAAYQGMESFRSEGSVRAWLFGIARRQCARRLQRGPKRHLELVPDRHASAEKSDRGLRESRRRESLHKHLSGLKPSEREVVLLRFSGELSFKEIAVLMDIGEATARKRASRALAQLRTQIHEQDID